MRPRGAGREAINAAEARPTEAAAAAAQPPPPPPPPPPPAQLPPPRRQTHAEPKPYAAAAALSGLLRGSRIAVTPLPPPARRAAEGAAFDVSRLRPRLPPAPVAEQLPLSAAGRPLQLLLQPQLRQAAAEMRAGAGDKVVLFGSFTEDETKQFQGQPGTSNSKSVEKTWELPEIQFGSLNFSVLNLQKASKPITKGALHPTKTADGQNKVNMKDNGCSNKKEILTSSVANGEPVLFNGLPTANVSLQNGVLESAKKTSVVVPSGVPNNNVRSSAPLTTPEVHHDGIKCTQNSTPPVMKITENGNTAVDTPFVAAPVDEDITSSNKKATSVDTPIVAAPVDVDITSSNKKVIAVDAPIVAAPVDEATTSSNKKVFQNKPLLPHGLRNTGNICFLNATLQALLACVPFVQLLQDLRNRSIPKAGYPTLSAFVEFISQFDAPNDSYMKKNEKIATAAVKALNPAMFDPVLRNFTPDVPAGTSGRPRQEDAQEFLSFAMDRMHDELLKLNGNGSNSKEGMVVSSADDDAWETVGKKNKSAIMRTQSLVPSELSAIFGGQLQSLVKATGNKASGTVQPFLLLHLDILPDAVQTLDDALRLFSAPESLEGYRTASGKAGVVTARKLVKIHTLSKIMVLHLKRFSYGNHRCSKLPKLLHFPPELVLSHDLLSSSSSEGRRYELVATITHHGNDPFRGHYTADAKYPGGQWLHFDDNVVTPISVNRVLHDQAYVLFYKQV